MNRNKNNAKRYAAREDDEREVKRSNSKGGSKPKSSRNSKRSSKRDESTNVKRLDYTEKYNDVTFYFKDPELLQQATQLSFQNFIGLEGLGNYDIPSIMVFYTNPSPGLTFQGSAPSSLHPSRAGINMSGLKLFNKLSMRSGRNMQYAPQDVTTLLLQLGELLSTYSYIKRAMGIVKVTNPRNRMYPKAIVEAMGLDYDDLIAHWADYRTHINAEISALGGIPILMNCGYLRKCYTMYDNIFTDSDSPMSQTYMFVPYTTWIIDEQSYSGGSILKTTPFCGTGSDYSVTQHTMSWVITNVLRPMIDEILESSTLNLIYADILNVGKDDPAFACIELPIIPDDYVIMPSHNYEALLHIHNLTTTGVPNCPGDLAQFTTPYNDVFPDPDNNSLIYNPGVKSDVIGASAHPLEYVVLDSPNPEPGLDERLEMTRYKSVITENRVTINSTEYFNYMLVPDHYVVYTRIFSNSTNPDDTEYFNNVRGTLFSNKILSELSQFDWAPMAIYFLCQEALDEGIETVHGDLNYYTIASGRYIGRLNQAVYLGLFDI